MKPTFGQKLDLLARNLTPLGLTLILVIVDAVPLHVPAFAQIAPMLTMVAIYHWAVYRPTLLPPSAVFAIGLLQDILGGTPLGVTALVLLSVHGVVVWQNRFLAGKSFGIVWLGFGLILAGACVETWILVSAFHGTPVNAQPLAHEFLITLGIYPPLSWLLIRWQQSVLKAD